MNEVCLGRGASRKVLPLGRLLGEGAAGKVYDVPAMPGAAAKLYHGDAEARRHEAKIDAMIANPPDLPPATHGGNRYPQIAWPQAKLFDRSGRFIGFLMPEINFTRSTSLVNLLQKNSRRVEKLSEYYGYRVLVARNLASVFAELHRAGHHMIDMKPANLRFYPQVSWMAVVDTDGFSIAGNGGRIPADQLSDEYIAPEAWKRPVGELGVEQDLFALAVIIFQLLNNGVHPFAGGSIGARGQATDLQARILDGLYPYALRPPPGTVPSTASVHAMFRPLTREMFDRAFLPRRERPSAGEWRDHLDALLQQLSPCGVRPEEHVHFGGGCGFCAHEERVAAASAKPGARRRAQGQAAPPRRTSAPARPARPGPMLPAVRAIQPVPMYRLHGPPAAYPLPSPPRRRRSSGVPWRSAAMLLLLAGVGYATFGEWGPLLSAAGVPAHAAENQLVVPEAAIDPFPEPREYLILPTGGTLSVPLHRGPGEGFPEVDRLSLHDAVIGRGTSRAKDGSSWVYVMRDSDGMAGFVPAEALLARKDANAPASKIASAPGNEQIAQRYRKLLDTSEGYERAYLSEQQKLWEDDRKRCVEDYDPAQCRRTVDDRRLSELDSWAQADKASKQPLPDFAAAMEDPAK
ncbi:hypothetical protein [Sphingomonas sp.]|uniref:hypothetical protein n=1 Tax=Sphingomonas sp. TaxID=28214 RepID=UPI001B198C5D|nr:hypothetical protein [Sphingomonas sp.]MBO9713846.1 hypothetical protein [Sphingomonas sp.]